MGTSTAADGVARQGSLRARNLALAARHIFASDGRVARVDVANATGMTRSTASRLVDDLVAGGIVAESAPNMTNKRGRPAVPLSPAAGTLCVLGLEVNVSHMAARIVDLTGAVLASADEEGQFVNSEPAKVVGRLAAIAGGLINQLPETATLTGIQVALPGLVDVRSNVLLRAPNLDWRDVDVKALLRDGGLTEVDEVDFGASNEADAAAVLVGHDAPGRPSGFGDFLYLSGEAGIGSALVRSGRVSLGARGWAGEIGHVCISPDGPLCKCGARGCLERYAGTQALTERAKLDTIEEFHAAVMAGDEAACQSIEEAGRALGIALSNALNLLDESTVVLGGDLALFINQYRPLIEKELATRHLARAYVDTQVLAATPDHAASALGAAYRGLERILDDPAPWCVTATDEPAGQATPA